MLALLAILIIPICLLQGCLSYTIHRCARRLPRHVILTVSTLLAFSIAFAVIITPFSSLWVGMNEGTTYTNNSTFPVRIPDHVHFEVVLTSNIMYNCWTSMQIFGFLLYSLFFIAIQCCMCAITFPKSCISICVVIYVCAIYMLT